MTMKTFLRNIMRNECGATAIEYGLLVACIGMAMVFGMKSFSASVYNMYVEVNNNTDEKVGGG
jgi:pilus assembly protein Flp/PilA